MPKFLDLISFVDTDGKEKRVIIQKASNTSGTIPIRDENGCIKCSSSANPNDYDVINNFVFQSKINNSNLNIQELLKINDYINNIKTGIVVVEKTEDTRCVNQICFNNVYPGFYAIKKSYQLDGTEDQKIPILFGVTLGQKSTKTGRITWETDPLTVDNATKSGKFFEGYISCYIPDVTIVEYKRYSIKFSFRRNSYQTIANACPVLVHTVRYDEQSNKIERDEAYMLSYQAVVSYGGYTNLRYITLSNVAFDAIGHIGDQTIYINDFFANIAAYCVESL